MRSRPCVCEGSNENCMYCGGRGVVGLIAPETSSSSGQKIEPSLGSKFKNARSALLEKMARMLNPLEPRSQATKRLASVPVLDRDVRAVPTHEPVQHIPPPVNRKPEHLAGILSIGATLKHSSRNQQNREVCRFCFRPVRFDGGTEKHLLKCTAITGLPEHPDLMNMQKVPLPLPRKPQPPHVDSRHAIADRSWQSISPSSFTTCNHCGARVKQKNINSHLRRVHSGGKETISKSITAGSSGRKPLPRDEVFKETFAQVNSLERRDKTRPYAHAFRENGRYGSHPIHDGFDDESGPE